jgi:catechol 2,3-dioxygenase-like lactoylglutathione lyase family enzyme
VRPGISLLQPAIEANFEDHPDYGEMPMVADVMTDIEVLFVAGFGPIVRDVDKSVALYRDALGLPLEAGGEEPDYFHTGGVDGVKHFPLWPLYRAALSCFGKPEWPADLPAPNAWIEFDVADVQAATKALQKRGYRLLVSARQEPWGQTVTRLLSPEGVLVGVTLTPFLREKPAK